jgi:hypothetical protein
MSALLDDPWIAAEPDAAVAPYRGIWSEEAILAFRQEALATLISHPTMLRLLREARPGPTFASGDVRVVDHAPAGLSQGRKTGST